MTDGRVQSASSATTDERGNDPRLLVVLFALLSILPFLFVVEGPFLFDDHPLIAENRLVHHFSFQQLLFSGFWGENAESSLRDVGQYFRPVVLASYALDWKLGGGVTWTFHLSNLVIAGLSAALTMATFLRWLGGNAKSALLCGIVFSLHPSKAETIAWISGRPDSLLQLGCMLALWGQAKSLGWSIGKEAKQPNVWLGAALQTLGVLTAFGSKEQAVVLPALVLVQLVFFRSRQRGVGRVWGLLRRDWWCVIGYGGISLLYLVLRTNLMPFAQLPVDLNGIQRLVLVADTLGRYLVLLIFPRDLSLFAAYQPLALVDLNKQVSGGHLLLGGAHAALMVAWLVLSVRRNARIFALAVLYVATILPVSQLVPMATDITASARYLYQVLIPVGALLALCVQHRPMLENGILTVTLVLGMGTSFVRASDFTSQESFWRYELAHNPDVPGVIGPNVSVDQSRGQLKTAVARARCGMRRSEQAKDVLMVERLTETFVDTLVHATPITDAHALISLGPFLEGILLGQKSSVTWMGAELQFEGSQVQQLAVGNLKCALLVNRAELLQRLGEPDVLTLAQRAVHACPDRTDLVVRASRLAVSSLDTHLAHTWLTQVGSDEAELGLKYSLGQISDRTRALLMSAQAGEAGAGVELFLTAGNEAKAVSLARAEPAVLELVSLQTRLELARAAYREGDFELGRQCLASTVQGQELTTVDQELQTRSGIVSMDEPWPQFVAGTCAQDDELD